MIGDISLKYCPVCESKTEHLQGCFKVKKINGGLFHLEASLSDSHKQISTGFKKFVLAEREGVMNGATPGDFVQTRQGGSAFEEFFARQVRSLKCTQCQHLIEISRLP